MPFTKTGIPGNLFAAMLLGPVDHFVSIALSLSFEQEKRVKVQVHEDAALNDHLLLVLESNTKLEKQA